MNQRTLVCTTVMHPDGLPQGTLWLIESAARFGIDVEVIGQGLLYENFWLSKCVRLWEAVAGRQEFDHIVFVDGTDTLFCAGLEPLHDAFAAYASDFVISGEDICWPYSDLAAAPAFDQGKRFRYPCAGFWMSTWDAFLREFGKLFAFPHTDRQEDSQTIYNCDQARYQLGIATGHLQIGIDVEQRLSKPLMRIDDHAEMQWGPRPVIRATGIKPCTIHVNGPNKTRLPKIRDLLMG
jgi:hypothetical protein